MDDAGFCQTVKNTHAPIRVFLAGCGVPLTDVDDLAQDVYVAFWQQRDRLPKHVDAYAWLKGVAKNKALAYFRRRKSHARLRETISARLGNVVRSEPAGTERFVEQETRERLAKCMDRLPARQREMIALRYQKRLVSEQIGRRMNMKVESVRKALHRIRGALRTCVQGSVATGMPR
jgi:RNA polymerase sigma-70 factor (ECF subfamily)